MKAKSDAEVTSVSVSGDDRENQRRIAEEQRRQELRSKLLTEAETSARQNAAVAMRWADLFSIEVLRPFPPTQSPLLPLQTAPPHPGHPNPGAGLPSASSSASSPPPLFGEDPDIAGCLRRRGRYLKTSTRRSRSSARLATASWPPRTI